MIVDRRAMIGALVALGCVTRAGAAIRETASARVIVDNDFAGDPDGLFALAHQLLAPKARCVLVTTSALDAKLAALGGQPAGASAAAGRRAALNLIAQMALATPPPVVAGAEDFGADTPNDAALAIVREAMRADPLPLFFACGGPLTNLAAALRIEPAIAARMTVVWIGGGAYPRGGPEYNLGTDLPAARQVVERSAVPLRQVPDASYRQFQISIAELSGDIAPISPLSQWLCARYADLPPFVKLGGAITLGDSPLVLLTAISAESSSFVEQPGRRILADGGYGDAVAGRTIRVYDRLDARLALADFAARLRVVPLAGRVAPGPRAG
jgi:hypothetical protein